MTVGTRRQHHPRPTTDSPPVAVVYRGPAAGRGCPEAIAALLDGSGFAVSFVGPNEGRKLSGPSLESAALYAQPGGAGLDEAYRHLRRHADDIRAFVHRGGRYLGVCLGAYLCGARPGFRLLPGDTDQYITSPGATVRTEADTTITVTWRGRRRTLFFQDGPHFLLEPAPGTTILATYDNGTIAAAVVPYGAGAVGIVGPHPEATEEWFAESALPMSCGSATDLGHDLITTLMSADVDLGG